MANDDSDNRLHRLEMEKLELEMKDHLQSVLDERIEHTRERVTKTYRTYVLIAAVILSAAFTTVGIFGYNDLYDKVMNDAGLVSLQTAATDILTTMRNDSTSIASVHAGVKAYCDSIADFKSKWVPVGTIAPFAGSVKKIPEGWALCDGRVIDLTRDKQYSELFAVIDTAFGPGCNKDGRVLGDFNLPDFRGKFLRGVAHKAGLDVAPQRDSRSAALVCQRGNRGNNVGSEQGFSTALPTQNRFISDTTGAHTHDVLLEMKASRDPGTNRPWNTATSHTETDPHATSVAGMHSHSIIGGDYETRPINSYVNWIIKVF